MKVEIWSDFVCPFCYIGKRRFEEALGQFTHKEQIEITFRAFELDPTAQRDGNPSVYDMLAAKYGMSREQAKAMTEQVAQQAKEAGLSFHFDSAVQTNTFDAHRLALYAAAKGKQDEAAEKLLSGYFTEGRHIGRLESLADIASEIGLDRNETLDTLQGDAFQDEVRADELEARQLGIRGVPFFLIDRKYAISGAQSIQVFLQTLERAWSEGGKA